MGALSGTMVLDLTRFFAGPYCTMMLADLGAEVIKIEEPVVGDGQRHIPPFLDEQAHTFIMLNRNKKGITLNLRSPRGKEILRELTKKADILIENYAPGVMARLGLSYEELRSFNPRLIYASVSGFGQTGPYRHRLAFDVIAQAMGGLMNVTGFPDNPPTRTGSAVADQLGSLYAAVGILAALEHRRKTGEGQAIDISLQDCVWALVTVEFWPPYLFRGTAPPRSGNSHPNVAPYGCYRAKDGYLVIAATTDAQWKGLFRAMGQEKITEDARFTDLAKRVENVEVLDNLIEEWTAERTIEEVEATLEKEHVPCGPVLGLDRISEDPQLRSRAMFLEVEQPNIGKVKVPGSVLKMSRTPGEVVASAPLLGQHNEDIYGQILGYSREEVDLLRQDGVI